MAWALVLGELNPYLSTWERTANFLSTNPVLPVLVNYAIRVAFWAIMVAFGGTYQIQVETSPKKVVAF
jgi:hypothetical protein